MKGTAEGPLQHPRCRLLPLSRQDSSDSHFKPRAIFAPVLVVSALPPQRPVSLHRCRIKPTNGAVTTEAFSLERHGPPAGSPLWSADV